MAVHRGAAGPLEGVLLGPGRGARRHLGHAQLASRSASSRVCDLAVECSMTNFARAGEGPVKVRCVAESILDDDNTTGEFLWMVGDEVLPAQDGGELEDMPEENRKRHSYFYYPIIDHDQKDLTCK